MLRVNVNINRSGRGFRGGESWVEFERENARMFHLVKKTAIPSISSTVAYSGRTTLTNYTGAALPELAWKFALYRRLGMHTLPVEFPGKGSRMLDGGKLHGKPGDAFSVDLFHPGKFSLDIFFE